jgi:hypothetical protein
MSYALFDFMNKTKLKPDESPESNIVPYEDINTKQARISGEKFPEAILGICDDCHWCYTSTNKRGIIQTCPVCNKQVSSIPMSIDEACIIEVDEKRGITIRFERRLPLR